MEPTPAKPRPAGPTAERIRRSLELARDYQPRLRACARSVSLCEQDAEDAVQRTLEIVLTRSPELDRPALRAWARTVARREALAIRRRRERALAAARGGDPAELAPATAPGPAEQAERRERTAAVAAALAALKPAERRAIALQAAGCSYAEIQAITGWTYTKVNRCLAEGRARLRGAGR